MDLSWSLGFTMSKDLYKSPTSPGERERHYKVDTRTSSLSISRQPSLALRAPMYTIWNLG